MRGTHGHDAEQSATVAVRACWSMKSWRQAFGIPRYGTEGSQRLHEAVSERAVAKGFKVPKRWAKTGWQQWQLDLLGPAPDAELSRPSRKRLLDRQWHAI
jgi:hypothetical protein